MFSTHTHTDTDTDTKVTMGRDEYVNQLDCGTHNVHVYQNIMLYTLNRYSVYFQLHLSKAENKEVLVAKENVSVLFF